MLLNSIKINDQEFVELKDIIYRNSGIMFAENKKYLLENRLYHPFYFSKTYRVGVAIKEVRSTEIDIDKRLLPYRFIALRTSTYHDALGFDFPCWGI